MKKTRAKQPLSKRALANGRGGQFVALARVSSREQEREGWSLEVQVDELNAYATRNGGTIIKLFRIAETATRAEERKTFKELIEYTLKHKSEIDGILFYKIDRAARNLFDYVELERLEFDHEVPFVSTSQPTDNQPAGRMARRMLAIIAAFYTEQQSLDVRDGQQRRVAAGLFLGLAPYGYRNFRQNLRGLIDIDPDEAPRVQYIFKLYAFERLTGDMIIERLAKEGIPYTQATNRWPRCKVYQILRDRSYLGEVFYQGSWLPGVHTPLVERPVFDRVQVLLGDKQYRSHELAYGSELIKCGHCQHPITGEVIEKKKTGKLYVYYRCARYNTDGHPRTRVTEAELDKGMLAILDRLSLPGPVRDWFERALRQWTIAETKDTRARAEDHQRRLTALREQQDRLLNLYTLGEIGVERYREKDADFRDQIARTTLQVEAVDRRRDEHAEMILKVFELSQTLRQRWVGADHLAKRRLLEIVCLNFRLDGVTLVPEWRKPFDVLAEGLSVSSSRGDRICTLGYENSAPQILQQVLPQHVTFTGDAIHKLIESGLYRKRRYYHSGSATP